eukprot:6207831-Pleurochrysis_carterae.AAC.1
MTIAACRVRPRRRRLREEEVANETRAALEVALARDLDALVRERQVLLRGHRAPRGARRVGGCMTSCSTR